MKYKVGDKVKIKTWEEMEKEFGLSIDGFSDETISCTYRYNLAMEAALNHLKTNRVITIKEAYVSTDGLDMYKAAFAAGWNWSNDMIEGLVLMGEETSIKKDGPINNRWEILDL